MRRAFVSHSSSDDSYVAEMEALLRAFGYEEVFNDVSSILTDEKFWPAIEKGIADCDGFVVVITFASNASEWVKREVEYARGLLKKIIPVWIEDCPIPAIFAERDVIDFRPRTRAERRFEISRIVQYAPAELIGREEETKLLNNAWEKVLRSEKGCPHVLTFVALGGEGKTSLVAKWTAELAFQHWPGCDAAFAWSFYSQGTREQMAISSDLFLKEALTFFGDDADKQFAASPAGAYEKGQQLARIVGQRRSLLILDGLEPLQYAPTSPTPGQLKDQGITALLKGLAATSRGLCVVTTRYSLPDLRAFWQTTAPEVKLLRLSRAAGVHLLQSLGVKGSLFRNIPFYGEQVNEFDKLVEDVKGHALTLNLLGTYLRDAHAGDIRKRDLVKLEEADAEEQGGHAFRVMEAYEREFEREGDKGQRALAVLQLLGLFDRPATADCLGALFQTPAIPGLTEPLVALIEAQRNLAFARLENARLLTVNRDASGALVSLDAHPLLREYFARQLRTHQLDAWRTGNARLYKHLCARTKEGKQPTLEDLQPLYHAIAHGCLAGLHQEVFDSVYIRRIHRRHEFYGLEKLSAFSIDLGALACFFTSPWSQLVSDLRPETKNSVLSILAYELLSQGRLTEAIEPLRASLVMCERTRSRYQMCDVPTMESVEATAYVVKVTHNLSELELTTGEIAAAIRSAERSVANADRIRDEFSVSAHSVHAHALHQAGRRAEAETGFRKAESIWAEKHPNSPIMPSPNGFTYCDLLLASSEQAAWRLALGLQEITLNSLQITACRAVSERAAYLLADDGREDSGTLHGIALDHLTLSRAALHAAIIEGSDSWLPTSEVFHIDDAVAGFRKAGKKHYLPLGLVTRALVRFRTGARNGPESAQADLDEAWEIAERGPMRLHMADIHLYRARLFFREAQYPWESPQADLAAAEKLINDCGYHRRDEELADAKAAILSQ